MPIKPAEAEELRLAGKLRAGAGSGFISKKSWCQLDESLDDVWVTVFRVDDVWYAKPLTLRHWKPEDLVREIRAQQLLHS